MASQQIQMVESRNAIARKGKRKNQINSSKWAHGDITLTQIVWIRSSLEICYDFITMIVDRRSLGENSFLGGSSDYLKSLSWSPSFTWPRNVGRLTKCARLQWPNSLRAGKRNCFPSSPHLIILDSLIWLHLSHGESARRNRTSNDNGGPLWKQEMSCGLATSTKANKNQTTWLSVVLKMYY